MKASYVMFPLGNKRFALSAELVTELARPDRMHAFPHTTPLIVGVLCRRGRIVPVFDIGHLLVGADAPPGKFYVIISRDLGGTPEWTAIPVTGECELVLAEAQPAGELAPVWIKGLLSLPARPAGAHENNGSGQGEKVEVLDIERLISAGLTEATA